MRKLEEGASNKARGKGEGKSNREPEGREGQGGTSQFGLMKMPPIEQSRNGTENGTDARETLKGCNVAKMGQAECLAGLIRIRQGAISCNQARIRHLREFYDSKFHSSLKYLWELQIIYAKMA